MKFKIKSTCTNCYLCLPYCPSQSIYITHNSFMIDPNSCTICSLCFHICPFNAIDLIELDHLDMD